MVLGQQGVAEAAARRGVPGLQQVQRALLPSLEPAAGSVLQLAHLLLVLIALRQLQLEQQRPLAVLLRHLESQAHCDSAQLPGLQ